METANHYGQLFSLVAVGFALAAIIGTILRARSFSLWRMYGFKVFGIYYIAKYGERRERPR